MNKHQRATLIFGSVGFALIALAWVLYLGPEDKFSFAEVAAISLITLGFISLTVVMVEFLWEVAGGDPVRASLKELQSTVALVNDGHVSGLRRVYTKASTFGSQDQWIGLLKSVRRDGNIDLMAYTLNAWLSDDFKPALLDCLSKGVKVRVLIMDPENELFASRGNAALPSQTQDVLHSQVKATAAYLADVRQAASKSANKNLEVRHVYSGSIKWLLTRVDNRVIALPYMFSVTGSGCPLMEVVRTEDDGNLYAGFTTEFDALWKNNPPRSAAPAPQPHVDEQTQQTTGAS